MKKFLLFVLLLTGCGQIRSCRTADGMAIDPELVGYYQEFIEALDDRGLVAKYYISSMKWADTLDNADPSGLMITAGVCKTLTWYNGYYHYVQINKHTPMSILRNTVWHESVHCALGLDHHEGEVDLMNPIVPETSTYSDSLKLLDKAFDRYQRGIED